MITPQLLVSICGVDYSQAKSISDRFPNLDKFTVEEIKKFVKLVAQKPQDQSRDIAQLLGWIEELEQKNKDLQQQLDAMQSRPVQIQAVTQHTHTLTAENNPAVVNDAAFSPSFLKRYDSILPDRWKSKFVSDEVQLKYPWWCPNQTEALDKVFPRIRRATTRMFYHEAYKFFDEYRFVNAYDLSKACGTGCNNILVHKADAVEDRIMIVPGMFGRRTERESKKDFPILAKSLQINDIRALPSTVAFCMPMESARFWKRYILNFVTLEALLHIRKNSSIYNLTLYPARNFKLVADTLYLKGLYVRNTNDTYELTELGNDIVDIHLSWMDNAVQQNKQINQFAFAN